MDKNMEKRYLREATDTSGAAMANLEMEGM
jgi:hypothetical protein